MRNFIIIVLFVLSFAPAPLAAQAGRDLIISAFDCNDLGPRSKYVQVSREYSTARAKKSYIYLIHNGYLIEVRKEGEGNSGDFIKRLKEAVKDKNFSMLMSLKTACTKKPDMAFTVYGPDQNFHLYTSAALADSPSAKITIKAIVEALKEE